MLFFCSYFDRNYLSRGLAMYRSLAQHCPAFELWILCMDDDTHRILLDLALPGVHPIALEDFEHGDEPLRKAKANRSRIEYFFTCTPSLPMYVLASAPEVNLVTYLDADLFFFANPQALFDEMGAASVAITAHRFSLRLKDRERYGTYNVGWISCRRDANGLACLQWWREMCIEWCFDREEDGRYADQKYLEQWPDKFQKVVVIEHKGANLAPWNLDNYEVSTTSAGDVTVDGQRLIFFHFHSLTKASRWVYDPGWIEYEVSPSSVVRSKIYVPYLKALLVVHRRSLKTLGGVTVTNSSRVWKPERTASVSSIRGVVRRVREMRSLAREVIAGRMIFFTGGG